MERSIGAIGGKGQITSSPASMEQRIEQIHEGIMMLTQAFAGLSASKYGELNVKERFNEKYVLVFNTVGTVMQTQDFPEPVDSIFVQNQGAAVIWFNTEEAALATNGSIYVGANGGYVSIPIHAKKINVIGGATASDLVIVWGMK